MKDSTTDALRLVPFCPEKVREELKKRYPSVFDGSDPLWDHPPSIENARDWFLGCCLAAAPASPLPEGGGQCSGFSGELKSPDLDALEKLADEATPGEWKRMPGRGLVRAIRDDLAVPLFEPLEPYSDPLLTAPTCRVGKEVVFRANSQGARESAAIRQAIHNAAFVAAANPATIKALIAELKEARKVAAYYADADLYTVIDRDTDLGHDNGDTARAFLARNGKREG